MVDKSGESLKSKMESVWRQTGQKPANWEDEPEFPEICKDVWMAFVRLHNSRPESFSGASPILYSEIAAYSQLYQIVFDEWELHLIKMFDKIARENAPKPPPSPPPKTKK